MFFLDSEKFEELVNLKLQRLQEEKHLSYLDRWLDDACSFNLPEMVKVICRKISEITSQTQNQTLHKALHTALMQKASPTIVKYLLDAGADLLATNEIGMTALEMTALRTDSAEIAQLILDSYMKIDKKCLNWPSKMSGATVSELALLNPNSAQILHLFSNTRKLPKPLGIDPLILAVLARDINKIKELIRMGADVNAVGQNDQTALHYICSYDGTSEIVSVLLESGADPNIQDDEGRTALHCAVFGQNIEEAKLLLKFNANPNIKMNDGRTSLHYAAHGRQMKLDKIMSLINLSDVQKGLFAFMGGKNIQEVVEQFKPSYLESVKILAAQPDTSTNKHLEIIEILLDAGADPNILDDRGQTPLHSFAALSVNDTAVELLLAVSVSPRVRNVNGHTPLDFAVCQNTNPKIIELLWPVTFDGTEYEPEKQAVAELALENENDEVRETVFRLMGLYET